MRERLAALADGLDDQLNWRPALRRVLDEPLAQGIGWPQVLGSGALFLFIVQAVTGVALAMHYSPSPREAYLSVSHFTDQVPFGRFIRGLHHWGASAMVVVVVLHLLRTFIWGAYQKPRRLTWVAGVGLLALVLAFSFTGYLLPYDQKAYWATRVGVEFAGQIPLVGQALERVMLGGMEVGGPTLTRFFIIHVLILPALLVPLVGMHLYLVRRRGETPPFVEPEEEAAVEKPQRFYPQQLYRDTVFAALLTGVLAALTLMVGVPREPPADPSAPYLPRPEWYYLPLFQLEKLRVGNFVLFGGPRSWLGTVVAPGLALLLLALFPFLGARTSRRPPRRIAWIAPGVMIAAPALYGILLAGGRTWVAAALVVLAGLLVLALSRLDPGGTARRIMWASLVMMLIATLGVAAKVGTDAERARVFGGQRAEAAFPFAGLAARGQRIFDETCKECHRIDGRGATTGSEFIRLTEGEPPARTRDEIILFIANPDASAGHPTRMPPAVEQGLSVADLEALAEYLIHYRAVEPQGEGLSFEDLLGRGDEE